LHLILLSGGIGKRLWPLSNESRSKQFIKLLSAEHNTVESISMLQRVWHQLKKANLCNQAAISTSKHQTGMIKKQLGSNIPLIIEPSRRDTYPAILLACSYLYSVKELDPHEVVIVLPVDIYVEDDFFRELYSLESIIQSSNASLALMGITPTFPSEKYGYIIPQRLRQSSNISYQKVNYFFEKPSQSKATHLLKEGAMWNSGVFAFKLKFIIEHLQSLELPLDYEKMVKNYESLPINSFDYEIVEKTNNVVVSPYKGIWKDLGTWNTLTEEMDEPLIGKGSVSGNSHNVHIINELDIPVSVLGLSNLVVAASPDGILVSDKEASIGVKDLANHFIQRPMYEEFSWGWYRVIDYVKYNNNKEVLTKRISISAHQNLKYQKHLQRREIWNVVNGVGLFALNGKIQTIKPGDVVEVAQGMPYSIKAITDLDFIEVQIGPKLIEEDVIAIFINWEEIENHCTRITTN